jgi:hypothetical protein
MILAIFSALIGNTILAFAQTGNPVVGADVDASGNGFGSATTNAQGNFNITSGLDTGNYTLDVSATGFLDATVQNINVTAGQETSNVTVIMNVSGGITGRILDATNSAPIVGAIVSAENRTGNIEYSSSNFSTTNGNYIMYTNLGTGRYNVSAFAIGYMTTTITNASVTVGQFTSNVNIALNRSAIITGTVTDQVSGAPLAGILISGQSAVGGYADSDVTNSSGMYTLNTNLGAGVYNITTFFPANHTAVTVSGVNVVAGSTVTQNLALPRSGIISGRITSMTGTPLAGVSVFANSGSVFGFADTNATGHYRITDGLTSGNYTVTALLGLSSSQTSATVTQGSETSNVNLQLTILPSGTITGRVTNSTGSPLADVFVSASGLFGGGTASTNATGHYVIDMGLLTGTYEVTVSEFGYVEQTRTNVNVVVGQVTPNIDFQLQAMVSGRISGRVITMGNPIPEFNSGLVMAAIFAVASVVIMLKKFAVPKFSFTRKT